MRQDNQENSSSQDQSGTSQSDSGNGGDSGAVDFDPGQAMDRVNSWVDGFVSMLPNIALAIVLLLIFWYIANKAKSFVKKRFSKHERPSLGQALGRMAKIAVVILGIFIALIIVAPSVKIGTVIGSLGIGSVAIGFAFKDILQNWLSGMLLLISQPFKIGDQIEANGFEGTVESIETRATILKTYDGEHAIIPNSELYTGTVLVKTKTSLSRGEYTIGVSYDADIDEVLELIRKELGKIEDVSDDPAPEAHAWELGDSSVNILARWWTDAHKAEQVRIRGEAVRAIKIALDKAGIDIPFPHLVSLSPSKSSEDDDADSDTEKDKAKA